MKQKENKNLPKCVSCVGFKQMKVKCSGEVVVVTFVKGYGIRMTCGFSNRKFFSFFFLFVFLKRGSLGGQRYF